MNAAAYARYSTDKQTDNSIAYQFTKIQEYCSNNSINIVRFYSDEGQSGTNLNRTGFQQMLADAQARKFDTIVIYDISRGSRDVEDWFHFRKTMKMLGIDVISTAQSLGDITDPNAFLTELISVGLGQHQVLDTRKKSLDGTAIKAKEGLFLGGYAPLGYKIVNGHYVIEPYEAKFVNQIFTMYADGKSYDNIIKALNGLKGRRGKPIGKNTLSTILKNERYIGVYTWNKKQYKLLRKWAGGKANPNVVRIENAIPAIIDKQTWERVQIRMSDNKGKARNKAKTKYLLSGLIECSSCGATYVGHTSTNSKGYKTRYYVCGNKYRTRTCKSKNINADKLEEFVILNLRNYLHSIDYNDAAEEICNKINNASPDLKSEKAELLEIERKLNNGVKAILNGLNFPELEDEMDKMRIRKSELEDIIKRAESTRPTVSKQAIIELFKDSIDNNNIEQLIKYHITKIYAHEDGSCTVNVGVHIESCGGQQSLVCATLEYIIA